MILDRFGRPYEERQDAWMNGQTGLGIPGLDKTKGASYWPVWRILDQELTSLYNGNDIAAKIISKPAEEMFRRGYAIEADNVSASEADDLREFASDYLELDSNMLEGKRWGRGYGGCLLVMGISDGRMPWEPLNEENILSFDSLALVDRRYSYVQSQYAAMNGPKYGKPEVYLISNAVAGYGWSGTETQKVPARALREQGAYVALVHESRVIRFDGIPADVVTRQQLAGWSWSVLQRVYDVMRQFDGAFDAANYLLSDASQGVVKIRGLMSGISAGQRQAIEDRIRFIDMMRSVARMMILDAGDKDGKNQEDFKREPTPFTGIPEMLDRDMMRLAAAADMPVTELFGRSAAGLNATGENDTRKWYDTIATKQENELGPQYKRVYRLLALAKKGPLRGRKCRFKIKFRPLWSPTDGELADTRLKNAQRDEIYIQSGVVKPEEVAVDLFDVYSNIDIEAREAVLEAGLRFDPYANEPAPVTAAGIAGKTMGEPLSAKAPVPLFGTTGTNVDPGGLAAIQRSAGASHGSQGPSPTPLPGKAAPPGVARALPPGKKPPAKTGAAARAASRATPGRKGKTPTKLDRQDSAALLAIDALCETREDGELAAQVFRSLLADYPARSLGWILPGHWHRGQIPLDAIDTSNRVTWTASSDGKTDKHVKLIEQAKSPPAVLVKVPSGKFIIVDGHHRYLASEKLGQPLDAFWCEVHVERGPWDELHTMQKRGSSKASGAASFDVASWARANAGTLRGDSAPSPRGAAFVVLFDHGGRVLCVSRPEPPYELSLPGGEIEGDESAEDAARRELFEETYVWPPQKLEPVLKSRSPVDDREVTIFAGTLEVPFAVASAREPGTRVAWLRPSELLAQGAVYRATTEALMQQGVLRGDAGDFEEAKHPRDPNGEFGSGGGGSGAQHSRSSGPSAPPETIADNPHGIGETAARDFHEKFEAAFKGSPFTNHVSHYSEADLRGMKTFTTQDGKAGIAVHDHGDGRVEGTALFNQGAPKGAGRALLAHAVQHAGVNYLECYGDGLRKLYESAGFKVETTSAFNPEYAAKDWNYEKFGRPNYYTLRLAK